MESIANLAIELAGTNTDWPRYLTAALLVLIRLSGVIAFAPVFNSAAIAPRIKAGFVIAMTLLLTPLVSVMRGAQVSLEMRSILGELGVGLIFGFSLMMMNEILEFSGMLLGMQFSFSLVNLMDPNSQIETPVLGQMLGWLGVLVVIGAGLDRTLIAAVLRSFSSAPLGTAVMRSTTGPAIASMAGGILLSGLQLAAPVIAAALTVEVTIALLGRLAPTLPSMVVSIPVKTLTCYAVLIASLAVWPYWIERSFTSLLDAASHLIGAS